MNRADNDSQTLPDDLISMLAAIIHDKETPDLDLVTGVELSLAGGLMRRGELEKAAGVLSQTAARALSGELKVQVADQLVLIARAMSKSSNRELAEKSEGVLRLALEVAPGRAAAPLAHYLQRQGRLDEAVELWSEAIHRNPQEAGNYLSLAQLCKRMGRVERALASCLDLVNFAPSAGNTLIVAGLLDELAPLLAEAKPDQTLKVALLGNATLDHLRSYLKVELYRAGLRPDIYIGDFGQYTQEILDPSSGLYSFSPDVVILAIHPSRLFPNLHSFPFDMTVEQRRAEIDAGLETLRSLLATFRQHSPAPVLVHNMVVPQHPALGTLDLRDELGQVAAFQQINLRLADMGRDQFKNVYIVDEDGIQSRYGKAQATDTRMWLTARLAWSDALLRALAREYLRFIRPLKGLSRKCIVLDLDNTLWGGVVGEDGLAGIQIGSEAPGSAYVAFQRELERLWRRGILLAISSKNNPEDALAVFEKHPDMVLKLSHFATHRINWEPKELNIRDIAQELNIGLDSLVFLDDNPAGAGQSSDGTTNGIDARTAR